MSPAGRDQNFLTGVLLLALGVLLLPAAVVIHEAAHAMAAVLVGFRLYRVAVGSGGERWRWRWRETTFVLGRMPWGGGHVGAAREPVFGWRVRWATICLAGPLANLFVAYDLFRLSRAHPHDWLGWAAFAFGFANALGVMTLLPTRRAILERGVESDGLQVITVLTCGRAALNARIVATLEGELAAAPAPALERARLILTLAPHSAIAAFVVGWTKLGEGVWAEARDLLRVAARSWRVPEDVEGQIQNGFAWAALRAGGPYDEALVAAQRAFELRPDSPAVMDTLGEALVRCGRPEEGLPLLERAWTALPEEPASNTAENRAFIAASLALAHRMLGRAEEAERWEAVPVEPQA